MLNRYRNMFPRIHVVLLIQSLVRLKKNVEISYESDCYPSYFINQTSLTTKKVIIIVAYWRSGSSFVGDLLQQNCGTFYSFEPLRVFSEGNILKDQNLTKAFNIMQEIINCNFEALPEYHEKSIKFDHYMLNNILRPYCLRTHKAKYCSSKFVAQVCRKSQLHVIKITRLTLKQVFRFVKSLNNMENVKIVHLVRDPRAIFNSRKNIKDNWCAKNDCSNITFLCEQMNDDVETFIEMKKQFPNNLFRIQYEQIALNTKKYSKQLFNALNINFSSHVVKFIQSHTSLRASVAESGSYSTIKDSNKTSSKWISQLTISDVHKVQKLCKHVLEKYNYKIFKIPENC
ncbi:secreted protein-like protein [Leptotrombidium deliense]|uniref:Secreted protein-like protein n=1 Tax=Leptotrombidium deliense TaxID=299467 RepID=A0A443S144_9ACAR|nr:secreted protein-like protein [Leptotrombidium deliense]